MPMNALELWITLEYMDEYELLRSFNLANAGREDRSKLIFKDNFKETFL